MQSGFLRLKVHFSSSEPKTFSFFFCLQDAATKKELDSGDALRLNIGLIAFGIGVANSLSRMPVGVTLDSKAQALG